MFSELWWVSFPHQTLGNITLAGMRKPTSDSEIQSLKSNNVIGIISLLDDTENHDLYKNNDMDFLWLAVKGGTAANKAQIEQANDYITNALQTHPKGIIATHCSGGRKRTGTLLAGVMILNGVDVKEAIAKVEQANPEIKLTDAQVSFLGTLLD